MARFERVIRFNGDESILMPQRKTNWSAGYDFMVAEDTILIPYSQATNRMLSQLELEEQMENPFTLKEAANMIKASNSKITLVPTGIKCYLDHNQYLELSVRSSCPLKHWLILANGVGIIDADYADNPDNDGEIFFQIINLSPYVIKLQKGDVIGQGIIKTYDIAEDEVEPKQIRIGGFGSTSK